MGDIKNKNILKFIKTMKSLLCLALFIFIIGNINYAEASVETYTLGGNGEFLQIKVDNHGKISIHRDSDGDKEYDQEQYYNGNCNGTVLVIDETKFYSDYIVEWSRKPEENVNRLNAISNNINGRTITTEFELEGRENIKLIQHVEYPENATYIKLTWEIVNNTGTLIENIKLIHGGDIYFAGSDSGFCYYDGLSNMVYVMKDSDNGMMGFLGDSATPANKYFVGNYSEGVNLAFEGELNNYVESEYIDNSYYLQWNKTNINSGEKWVVKSIEKFTEAGKIQVFGEIGRTTSNDCSVTSRYMLQNLSDEEVNITTTSRCSENYNTSIRGGFNNIVIPPNQSVYVLVDTLIPEYATDKSNFDVYLDIEYQDGDNLVKKTFNNIVSVDYTYPVIQEVSAIETGVNKATINVKFKNVKAENTDVHVQLLDSNGSIVLNPAMQTKNVLVNKNGSTTVDFNFNTSSLAIGKYYIKAIVDGVEEINDSYIFEKKDILVVDSALILTPNSEYSSTDVEVKLDCGVFDNDVDNIVKIEYRTTGAQKTDGWVTIYSTTGSAITSGSAVTTGSSITTPSGIVALDGIIKITDITAEGITDIEYRISYLGYSNYASGEGHVKIDKITPTLSYIINKDNPKAFELNILATDDFSGISHITTPNGNITLGSALIYNITKNGIYNFKATDKAGNVTNLTINITEIYVDFQKDNDYDKDKENKTNVKEIIEKIDDLTKNVNVGDLDFENIKSIKLILEQYNKLKEQDKELIKNYSNLTPYINKLEEIIIALDTSDSMFNDIQYSRYKELIEEDIENLDVGITREDMASIIYNLLKTRGVNDDNPFKDENESAVLYLAELGIVKGYTDNTYKPDIIITRAEAVAMLARAMGIDAIDVNSKFKDIDDNWARGYINGFKLLGYVKGYPDTAFRPNEYITKAELMVLLCRILNITDIPDIDDSLKELSKDYWAYKEIIEIINGK